MTEIHVATANLGNARDGKVRADILRLFDDECIDTLSIEEAGDRNRLLRSIADGRRTIDLYDGDGSPGATSTPVMWRSDVWQAIRTHTVRLSSRFWAPEGVGPNWVKPKVLNVVWLQHRITGEIVVVCSTHMPASLWARLRAILGGGIIGKVARFARNHDQHPLVIGADWNAKVGSPILRRLRTKGHMNSAQQKRGVIATHGKRAIDDLWTRKLRVTNLRAVETSSDHRALIATANLR
jgi:hypothetical protein